MTLVALIVAGYVTLNAAVVAVLYLARTGERRRETEERHRRSIQPELILNHSRVGERVPPHVVTSAPEVRCIRQAEAMDQHDVTAGQRARKLAGVSAGR